MPAPTGVTISGTMVILEMSDSATAINSRDDNVFFGTIVLRGSGATTYSDGDVVLAKDCTEFQEDGLSYVITTEANILLEYTAP